MAYGCVVVGSDGSATAERAVRTAAETAAAHGARLVIVTAYTPDADARAAAGDVPDDVRWAVTDVNQAEERVRHGRDIAAEAGVDGTITHAVAGRPEAVLLDVAGRFTADLIVVGSVGLTNKAHALLGSVAASIAHHAPCDVLIVQTTA
ncbi:MAG TPA: universal stress protein [Acidimicrobiales bacterium]|nr:universal stress protein [Acidimicrobiales bacterium]